MCVCVSVCLSVCLFTFELLLNIFLPPLPKVWCPNFVETRNPWEKVMERRGFQIWKLLLIKGANLPRQKKQFLTDFFICIFAPISKVQCPNFLDFWNSLRKVMEISGLRFWKLLLIKGVKSLRKKKKYFGKFCLAWFFWYMCYYPHRPRDALSPVCVIFSSNPGNSVYYLK